MSFKSIQSRVWRFPLLVTLPLLFLIVLFVARQTPPQNVHAQTADTSYKVKVYYFYAKNTPAPDTAKINHIQSSMQDIQKWYQQHTVNNKTFDIDPTLTVVAGDNTADYYATASATDTWHNIENEMKQKYGDVCGSKTMRIIFVTRPLDTFSGGPSCGWWNNGQVTATTPGQFPNSGTAIMNDDIIDVDLQAPLRLDNPQYPNGYCLPHNPSQNPIPVGSGWCVHNTTMGGMTHEIGHAFSLAHPSQVAFNGQYGPAYQDVCNGFSSNQQYPECYRSALHNYFLWPNNELLDQTNNPAFAPDKTTILNSPWFWNQLTDITPIPTPTPLPSGVRYLSDVAWASATAGWGTPQLDKSIVSNALLVGNVYYNKGIGTHANSDITYALNGLCTSLSTGMGIDSETGSAGSSIFQIWADGTKLFDSGLKTGGMSAQFTTVSLTGKQNLLLRTLDAGDGNNFDHTDWVDSKITCSAPTPTPVDTTAPTVTITSPANGSRINGQSVTIRASASDNVGVTKVQFYIDNSLKSTVFSSPYTYVWDIRNVSRGTHTIKATAFDAANNSASAQISVTK